MKSSKSQPNKPSRGSSRQQEQSGDRRASGRQQQAASGAGGQYGEGNYEATRQYNQGLKEHMEGHDIEKEARDAAPKTAAEESEMLAAERKGRSRARGESPDRGDDDNPEGTEK